MIDEDRLLLNSEDRPISLSALRSKQRVAKFCSDEARFTGDAKAKWGPLHFAEAIGPEEIARQARHRFSAKSCFARAMRITR